MTKLTKGLLSEEDKYEQDETKQPSKPEQQQGGGDYQAMGDKPVSSSPPIVASNSVLARLYSFFKSSTPIQKPGLNETLLSDSEKNNVQEAEAGSSGYEPPKPPGQ